jgi:cysteine desulfurase/selenocysteine lyase
LVYFDNAATTQKPKVVIDTITNYYINNNSNVYRSIYSLGSKTTKIYEQARENISNFFGIVDKNQLVFTKNSTDGFNFIVQVWGRSNLKMGDEVLLSYSNHHSNIAPWIILSKELNFNIKLIPILSDGTISFKQLKSLINEKTKVISISHASNVFGSVLSIEKISKLSIKKGILFIVDGSQAIPHIKVNLDKIDCDFYVFTGHKIFAPTGIGGLYINKRILEKINPYQYGGGMLNSININKNGALSIDIKNNPMKFEAGTPNISGVLALSSALNYLKSFSWKNIYNYEKKLLSYAIKKIKEIPNIKIFYGGNDKILQNKQIPLFSFLHKKIHAHDIGTFLCNKGIAIRVGSHCSTLLMKFLKISSVSRISFSIYNEKQEIKYLINSIKEMIIFFNRIY